MKSNIQEKDFNELYAKHKKYVFSVAYNILKNSASAEDITQDVFIKLFAQPKDKLKGRELRWLIVVAKNTALKALKKNEKFVSISTCDIGVDATQHSNNVLEKAVDQDFIICTSSPMKKMLRCEQQKLCSRNVHEALKKLSPRLQELVKLRSFKHMSYKQIARTTKLSEGNVGFLLNKASTKLKKILTNDRELLNEV